MAFVTLEKKDHIACITLNRPDRFNSFGTELRSDLIKAENEFASDPDAWVAIYTGAGDKAFCAGLDLKEATERARENRPMAVPSQFPVPLEHYKPTIAAVNGAAYGGGFELVQRCDIRICSENAVFAMAEVKRGLTPVTGLFTLPRLIGQSNALWLLLSGEPIDAQEAYRIGLVTKVVPLPELMATATRMAEILCENSPLAVRAIKQLAKQGMEVPMDYARRLGATLIDSIWGSEDAKEGISSFIERRKPLWKMK